MTRKNDQAKPRVRGTLLVLVCLWALCNFMVIDLFLNVPEFDGIRPRAPFYRAMRYTGHEMVGEPYQEGDFAVADVPNAPPDTRDVLEHELARLTEQRHRMDASNWARLRQVAAPLEDRLDEPALQPQLTRLRATLGEVMVAAAKPGAPYGGGVDALALAAAVGDESTWELFVRMIRARDTVIAKLPLTTARDDLTFLDHAMGAVAAKGTRPQRAELADEIAAALRTERDPDTRRLWVAYETQLQSQSRGKGS
ncbi:MAG: hypothetical protein O7C98_02290 [Planctomycetota bacterium]|nr:hypothetical protein [Planctomycetota bacterium]